MSARGMNSGKVQSMRSRLLAGSIMFGIASVPVAGIAQTPDETTVAAPAGDALADPSQGWSTGVITVTASRGDVLDIGGSVHVLDAKTLDTFSYGDVNRVLRAVPGVNLQEEDGFGLRPNIGIRGSGTDRSARVAVMEDGVLIAPAPYAASAAYYFPRLARITGVEVSKGPAAIKYGPLTVGGAINLFSTPIPDEEVGRIGVRADLLGGNYDSYRAHGAVGGWFALGGGVEVGGLIEGLREHSGGFKRIDRGGDTGFGITDIVAKFGLRTADGRHSLIFKYQNYDETSNETYLGLTLADFAASPNRRYNASQLDQINVTHKTYQATHDWTVSDSVRVTTTAYRTDTARSWYKLNDIRNTANTGWTSIAGVLANPAAAPVQYAELTGGAGFTGRAGSLRVRDNNRVYQATGVQSVLAMDFTTGSIGHTLELSARYHEDSEDRFQQDDRYQIVNGTLVLTSAGAPGSQDNRIGEAQAWAFYIRDTIELGNLTIVPGLRYETIDLRQTSWALGDATRATPTSVRNSKAEVWIPGVSATLTVAPDVRLIAGAHRGFANPAPGSTVAPETSWNYEAGVRLGNTDWHAEIIGFFNDYSNLVGTCTASTGGGCTIGDQFSGGKVDVKGVEISGGHVLGTIADHGFEVPVSLAYTLTDGRFKSSFASSYGPWATVRAGDRLPYLPRHQMAITAGVVVSGASVNATLNWVSKARAVAGQGTIPLASRIDDRVLVDLSARVEIIPGVDLFGTVQNLFDVTYNASFSPDGARPGAPRMAMGGVKLRF